MPPRASKAVTPILLQEDPQGVAQPGLVIVVVGERPKRLDDPGPHQLDRVRHQRQRRDLGEAGQARSRRASGQRDGVGGHRLSVGATEPCDPSTWSTEGEPDLRCYPGTAAAGNPGVTEIVKIKGRGHALVIDIGWRKVADTALAFVQRFAS